MTKLAANCGCGWRSKPADQSKQTGNTVRQAQEHADLTGHKVEVHGWVAPRSVDSLRRADALPRNVTGR